MIRESFPRPDLIGSHIWEQGTQLFPISVSGEMKRLFFKGGGTFTLIMEPGFSHCSTGHDFFKHTGRKLFLLDEMIYSSQSWSGKHVWTHMGESKMWACHCVVAEEVGRMSSEFIFLRKEREVGLTLLHLHWRGRRRCGSRTSWELVLCRWRKVASSARSRRARLSQCTQAAGCFSRQFWQKWVSQPPALLRGPWPLIFP